MSSAIAKHKSALKNGSAHFKFGGIEIDVLELASRGNAVLGIRDSGKTYTATALAEKLMSNGIPIIVFDPVGLWRFLRVPGAGKGYPVVVAGGMAGDLPLTVKDAPDIVRAAMKAGVSLVIDLFSKEFSKSNWKAIVAACVEVLIYENQEYGLRHVIIEEAAEFIPQRVDRGSAVVYGAMEKLARIGGNSRLGFTLINPRPEDVNKAVLELCDNLFLHRQKGRNTLKSLSKWLDVGNVEQIKPIMDTMSSLPSGECWVWLKDHEDVKRIKVPQKNSMHPNRRIMHGAAKAAANKAVDVGTFVANMKKILEKPDAKVAAKTKAAPNAKQAAPIVRTGKGGKPLDFTEDDIDAAYLKGKKFGFDQGTTEATEAFLADRRDIAERCATALLTIGGLRSDLDSVIVAVNAVGDAARKRITKKETAFKYTEKAGRLVPPPKPMSIDTDTRRDVGRPNRDPVGLKPALQAVLNAVAWWRHIGFDQPERGRVAVVAGYSPKASTIHGYIATLAGMGLLETPSGAVRLTAAGVEQADIPIATSRDDLRKMARDLLKPQPQRVFDAVYDAYPNEIRREDIAEAVGLSAGASTVHGYIADVANYGIIETASKGAMRAAAWLFPE